MDLPRLRLEAQRLLGPAHDRPEDVVQSLLAVQSQDIHGAKWAVAQRTSGALEANPVISGGRIIGGWKRTLSARELLGSAALLRPPSAPESQGLAEEVARYGRSLGLPARLETTVPADERRQRKRSPASAAKKRPSSARAPR
jgi:hypothetical protein